MKMKTVVKRLRTKHNNRSIAKWFAELDRLRGDRLFPNGRIQPIHHTESEKKRFFRLVDELSGMPDVGRRKRIKAALGRIAFGME